MTWRDAVKLLPWAIIVAMLIVLVLLWLQTGRYMGR